MAYAVGEDRSSFQPGSGSWSKNAFGFCKATEGLNWTDPTFAGNWKTLADEEKVRGAYHFFHPALDAVHQASYFVDFVGAHGGWAAGDVFMADVEITVGADGWEKASSPVQVARMHLPLQVLPDVSAACAHQELPKLLNGAPTWCAACRSLCGGTVPETNAPRACTGCAQARASAAAATSVGQSALAFLEALKALVPANQVLLYTDLYMATTDLGSCTAYPLFVADYSGTPPPSVAPWKHWTFWQHSDKGGQGGGDADFYNGDEASLLAWAGAPLQPPAPPPPSPLPAWQSAIYSHLPELRMGDNDVPGQVEWVRQAQLLADIAGSGTQAPLTADGQFGPRTMAYIEALQLAHKLTADGIIGPVTWSVLAAGGPANVLPILGEGSVDASGVPSDVHRVQALCNVHGIPLTIDGVYGQDTKAAIEVLQAGYSETADGVVGDITWALLLAHAKP